MTTPGQGWGNPVVGGTTLRIPAIQSPNFVHGVSGWAIFQNGAAEFNSIVIPPGTSGNTIFTQATAPTALNVGDLWIDTASANAIFVWNGSSWVAYQFGTSAIASGSITAALIAANTITAAQIAANTITASQIAANTITAAQIAANTITASQIAANTITASQIASGTITATQIAANTITASQLAAGIVYAGIVDGTEIDGGILRAKNSHGATVMTVNKSSGTWVLYQDLGSASQGGIIASGAHASGTDEFSNSFQAGVVAYDGVGGYVQMTESGSIGIINFVPGTATHITKDANILGSVVNAGLVNEYEALQMQSGAANSHNVTTIQLLSDSSDATLSGVIKFFYANTVQLAVGNAAITVTAPMYIGPTSPVAPASSIAAYSDNGSGQNHLKYRSDDGATYATGRITATGPNNQNVTSMTFVSLTGLGVALGVGSYRFRAVVQLKANANAGQWLLNISFTGTATCNYGFKATSAAGVVSYVANEAAFSTALGGPATSVLGFYEAIFEGEVTVSVAGTLAVNGRTTVSADTFNVFAGSSIEAVPVV